MLHNLEQARLFLQLLTGSDDTPVTWQVFHDPKNETAPPDLAKHFVATLDDSLEFLTWSQQQHCGVYVGINETDGKGRENHNITGYRAVFADFDGMTEPTWSLIPHFVQKRDNIHGHAFWLVSDIADADTFKALQKRIAIYHNTDHQVTDPARVVRIAGFNHYKNPTVPAQYVITDDNTDDDHKYTVAEIEAAFPLTAEQDAELNGWLTKRKGIQEGSGYRYDEKYISQFTQWLINTAPIAIIGEGSHTVFKVAGWAHDHGIPLEITQGIMWEHYNPRCQPPWGANEIVNFYDTVQRAYYYANSAAGCKTAIGSFTSHLTTTPLPEPIGGWDKNREIGEENKKNESPKATVEGIIEQVTVDAFDGRWNFEQASIMTPQLNAKSSHADIAMMVDGLLFNGCDLIRNQGIFYEYKNKRWNVISDEVIKARIFRALLEYKPNDSMTRGVFNVLCDVVNAQGVEVGEYLNDNKRDTKNLVVFNNGLVDLSSDNPVLEPHDRNLFSFNTLSYNWNTSATCPKFHAFLNSLGWDEKQKIQLMQWLGYLLTSDISLQKFAVFVGKSRGGKGVLTDIIRIMVGNVNVAAPSLSSLFKDHVLESLSTKSLALIPDAHNVAFNSRDSVLSTLKSTTGADPISFNVKFKPAQTMVLKTRFILSTNNVPEFNDASGALANRMLVFPFTESFAGRENTNLRQELLAEIEGIAQEALRGLRSLRVDNGKFTESDAGLQEKQDIKEDMFPLSKFVIEACNCVKSENTSTATLYHAYKIWCTTSGIKQPMTEIQFSKTLRNSDLPIVGGRIYVNGGQVRGFTGLTLSKAYQDKINISTSHNVVQLPPIKSVK